MPRGLQGLGREQRLKRRRRPADNCRVDLDNRPEVHQNTLLEGVFGEGVRVNGVEANDGRDGCEGTDAEDEDERDLFSAGPVDLDQGFDGKGNNPDIRDDVEARGDYCNKD